MNKVSYTNKIKSLIHKIYYKVDQANPSTQQQFEYLKQIETFALRNSSEYTLKIVERLSLMETMGTMTLEIFRNRLERSYEQK